MNINMLSKNKKATCLQRTGMGPSMEPWGTPHVSGAAETTELHQSDSNKKCIWLLKYSYKSSLFYSGFWIFLKLYCFQPSSYNSCMAEGFKESWIVTLNLLTNYSYWHLKSFSGIRISLFWHNKSCSLFFNFGPDGDVRWPKCLWKDLFNIQLL